MKVLVLKIFCVIGIIFGFYLRYKIFIPTSIAEKINLSYTDQTIGTDLFQLFTYLLIFLFSVLLVLPTKNLPKITRKKLLVSIVVIVIITALYSAPVYFNYRELANTATIEANQGKAIELTESIILGITVERFPEKSCAIFRWENCMTLIGCEYLEYSKDENRSDSCYFKSASRSQIYSKEWARYFYD